MIANHYSSPPPPAAGVNGTCVSIWMIILYLWDPLENDWEAADGYLANGAHSASWPAWPSGYAGQTATLFQVAVNFNWGVFQVVVAEGWSDALQH
jgi:hypothetical protein